jgi:hypothetical protein
LGDRGVIAAALGNLATIAHDQGDFATAQKLSEESLLIRREIGNRRDIAVSPEQSRNSLPRP